MMTVSQRLAVMNEISFPVEKKQLYFEKLDGINSIPMEVPNRFAIVRPDTNAVLGVVSDKYKVVSHAEHLAKPIELLEDSGYTVTGGGNIKDGHRVIVQMESSTDLVMAGDHFKERIYVSNSFDGTSSFQFSYGYLRLICTNGMVGFSNTFNARFRHHVGDVFLPERLEAIKHFVLETKDRTDANRQVIEKMAGTKYTQYMWDSLIERAGYSRDTIDGILSAMGKSINRVDGNTIYLLWQGITDHFSVKERASAKDMLKNHTETRKAYEILKTMM